MRWTHDGGPGRTGPRPRAGAGFPAAEGDAQFHPRPSTRTWLSLVALAVVNRLVPKVDDKVVLHSTIDLEDGVLAVVDELHSRGRVPVVLVEDWRRAPLLRAATAGRARLVPKRSVAGVLQFLTARTVMTTENVYGNGRPPSSQLVVNLWHGEPPVKPVARFLPGQRGRPSAYAPVASAVGRAYRAAEFDLSPLRVPVIGAPRNDRMLRSDAAAVRRQVLGDDARPTFLWLPTFRAGAWGSRRRVDVRNARPGLPFAPEELSALDGWLMERGARIVVKLHPHDDAAFATDLQALRVLGQDEMERAGLTLYPLMPAFDALITDVSSVWLDHLLLDKPMVFAFPDVEEYRRGRGLNLEPYEHWVPGPFCRTLPELLAALEDLVEGRDVMAEERRRARLRFHRYHDDQSSARLLDGLGIRRVAPRPNG